MGGLNLGGVSQSSGIDDADKGRVRRADSADPLGVSGYRRHSVSDTSASSAEEMSLTMFLASPPWPALGMVYSTTDEKCTACWADGADDWVKLIASSAKVPSKQTTPFTREICINLLINRLAPREKNEWDITAMSKLGHKRGRPNEIQANFQCDH